ncbi:hypothetical protein RclHR1_00460038 [Rhizophagus clarus]|uniref:Endopolyphosphatase n=1 Tax=Rhizophagus clarus TaxID=94130 RepID=A0A2Z6RZT4_9GLOM|nr:hypothetical protein RclHR1_00460038 [Rhizophagus clarus]GES80054.1 metallo-dependent phosphatase-like protein [Rhizophagus clarus]
MVVSIQLLYFIVLSFLFSLVIAPFYLFEPKTIPINVSPTVELHGNFLHITDFHPDSNYVSNVTARSRCHEVFQDTKRPKHMKKGISGPWGAPATVCDSPLSLIDATFEWLEKNWKNKIDFVIWTGDNARHDNDDNIPRTPEEIFTSNRMIAEKFLKTFGDEKNFRKPRGPHFIPIIPSIGNNDIHPNNIITSGPNELLTILYNIWSPFIPKGQHKTFLNGGYFYTEVIPNKLMVVSLNTLYFYKANTAVNGCKAGSQPGTIEMKWLNDVLKKARKHGMKVYLTGHVAPRAKQYTRSCYRKYGRLALKYHDIILGHFYGHSNMDHFFFINAKAVRGRRRPKFLVDDVDNTDINDDNEDIYDEDYDDDDDDYDVNNEYEEEEEDDGDEIESQKVDDYDDNDEEEDGKIETNVYDVDKYTRRLLNHYDKVLPRSKGLVEKEYAVVHINPSIIPTFFPALRIFKYNTTVATKDYTKDDTIDDVDSTRKRRKHRPSVTNTFLTPLGYTQYFINLTHANLYPNITPEYTIEYNTWDDYHMKDLTISSWLQLAQKIVTRGLRSSLWKKVQEHLMVGTRSLIRRKKKKSYEPADSREKGPEDYMVSELAF